MSLSESFLKSLSLSESFLKVHRANQNVQAVGGEWPARVILIAWGAEMERAGGFHPIDSVVHDMKDKVSFYNIGAEFELNPVCIGKVTV